MRERFAEDIKGHRLRREIIATQLSNAVINRAGPTVAARLAGEAGLDRRRYRHRAAASDRQRKGVERLSRDIIDGILEVERERVHFGGGKGEIVTDDEVMKPICVISSTGSIRIERIA